MKRGMILAMLGLGVLLLGVAGCREQATNSAYDRAMAKGLDAVAQDKIERAASYFENALDQKSGDQKAKIYLKQATGYLNTEAALAKGDPAEASELVTKASAIKHGAKALTHKLTSLSATVKANLKEYNSVKQTLGAAEKLVKSSPSQANAKLADLKSVDWAKKSYLSQLHGRYTALVKQVGVATKSAKAAAATSVNAAEAKKDRQMIMASFDGIIDPNQLAKVPDSAVIAAVNQSKAIASDIGYVGQVLMRDYPNIKVQLSLADVRRKLIARYPSQTDFIQEVGGEMIERAIDRSDYQVNSDIDGLGKALMRISLGSFDATGE